MCLLQTKCKHSLAAKSSSMLTYAYTRLMRSDDLPTTVCKTIRDIVLSLLTTSPREQPALPVGQRFDEFEKEESNSARSSSILRTTKNWTFKIRSEAHERPIIRPFRHSSARSVSTKFPQESKEQIHGVLANLPYSRFRRLDSSLILISDGLHTCTVCS